MNTNIREPVKPNLYMLNLTYVQSPLIPINQLQEPQMDTFESIPFSSLSEQQSLSSKGTACIILNFTGTISARRGAHLHARRLQRNRVQ